VSSFISEIDRLLAWKQKSNSPISAVTVSVTEKTARPRLKLKKKDPLVYKGLELKCVGTRAWRLRQQEAKQAVIG
jgi:hypothetical protein